MDETWTSVLDSAYDTLHESLKDW